jgi:hypothetical protein
MERARLRVRLLRLLDGDMRVGVRRLDVVVAHQLPGDAEEHPAALHLGPEEVAQAMEPEAPISAAARVRPAERLVQAVLVERLGEPPEDERLVGRRGVRVAAGEDDPAAPEVASDRRPGLGADRDDPLVVPLGVVDGDVALLSREIIG